MRKYTLFLLLFLLCAAASAPAQALTIRNIDYEPRALTIVNGGERTEVTIPPRGAYRTLGVSFVLERPGQKPRNALAHEEYMIYKDTLYLQRRNSRPGNGR